jgi:restriction endonuclease S subunit
MLISPPLLQTWTAIYGYFPCAFCLREVKDESYLRNIVKVIFPGQSSENSLSYILLLLKNPDFKQKLKQEPKTATFYPSLKAQAFG